MVTRRLIEQHPEAIREWVQSLQEAGRTIHADPQRAGNLQQPYMNLKSGDVSATVKSGTISYETLAPDREKLNTLHALGRECGILEKTCDFDKFINPYFAT